MKVNVLVFLGIALGKHWRPEINSGIYPQNGHPCSTFDLLINQRDTSVNKYVRVIILLFLLLPLNLNAQLAPVGSLKIRTNDPEIIVTVDNRMAKKGETVTITLTGDLSDKTVSVKAGRTFGQEDLTVQEAVGSSSSDTYACTFVMPDWNVYIDIVVQLVPTENTTYPLAIETPGVATNKVSITIEGEGCTGDIASGYRVKAGSEVTVTLQTPLAARLTLTGTEAYAPDGSWRWVDLSGNRAVTEVTFTMPVTAVTVRFFIHEDTTPVPPINPPVDPDEPDEPDVPDTPDPDPVANEPIGIPGLHIRFSGGQLWVETGTPRDIFIYTFSGRMVRHLRLEAGGWQQIMLSRRGPYILYSGGHVIKFNL